jgi:hypothetical protein
VNAVRLRRIDPACNMHRFYRLDVQPDHEGNGDASAHRGAWWPSLTTAKPLPPSPCSGRPSEKAAGIRGTVRILHDLRSHDIHRLSILSRTALEASVHVTIKRHLFRLRYCFEALRKTTLKDMVKTVDWLTRLIRP